MIPFPDPRVQDWPLMATPGPILSIFLLYIVTVKLGPKFLEAQKPIDLSSVLVVYNFALVVLSAYMCYEVRFRCFNQIVCYAWRKMLLMYFTFELVMCKAVLRFYP